MTGILKVDQWKDSGDNALITSDGSGALTFNASSITGVATTNGITEADQWRLSTSFTGDASPISSNLERVDTNSPGLIGTGMTESSGIFTFPSTGIYLVTFTVLFNQTSSDNSIEGAILLTTNNSSYSYAAIVRLSLSGSTGENVQGTTSSLVDVTDTSNVKVRFDIASNAGNNNVRGGSTYNETHMTFIRLGDT